MDDKRTGWRAQGEYILGPQGEIIGTFRDRADAALGAAAPALLEALRLAREYVVPEALGLSNSEYADALDAVRQIEAAIKLATTGEES